MEEFNLVITDELEKGKKALPDGTMKKYANGWYRKEGGKWVYQKGFKGPKDAQTGDTLTPEEYDQHKGGNGGEKEPEPKAEKEEAEAPAAKEEAPAAGAAHDDHDHEAHAHFTSQIHAGADDDDVEDIAQMLARQKAKGKLTPQQEKLYAHVQSLIKAHKSHLSHHLGEAASEGEKAAPAAEKEAKTAPEPKPEPAAKVEEPKAPEAPAAEEEEDYDKDPTPEELQAALDAMKAALNKAQETGTKIEPAATPEEIGTAIKGLTPESRSEINKKLYGYDPKQADAAQVKAYQENAALAYDAKDTTASFGPDGLSVPAKDYTQVKGLDILLIDEKNILDVPKPAYIPDVSEADFRSLSYQLPTVKLADGNYLVALHRYQSGDEKHASSAVTGAKTRFAVMTPDMVVATGSYYFNLAKAKARKEHDAKQEKYAELWKAKGYEGEWKKKKFVMKGVLNKNKMSYPQYFFMQNSIGSKMKNAVWDAYNKMRKELGYKEADMEMQMQDLESTYFKGKETSYGDTGATDQLLDSHGVKIKMQNGSDMTPEAQEQIKKNLDDVYNAFGDLSSMSKNWNLKISHAGQKNQHAKMALGIFTPGYHAIGVTNSMGDHLFGHILAHEFGHFMDYYAGSKQGHHYESSINGSKAHGIADKFRDLMEKPQSSEYQTKTCECFARAMEQYYIEKKGGDYKPYQALFLEGNHPKPDVFKKEIMPLIDEWFAERKEMLKSVHADLMKNF
jgi:hypothetical protein